MSFDSLVRPGRLSNSFSKAGINEQISLTLSLAIPAACSLPPDVMNNLLLGYKMQRHIKIITDKNDLESLYSM